MPLPDLTLVGFLCVGGLRCVSYLPQIMLIARDRHGAAAISFSAWAMWAITHLATACYAGLNLNDAYLAAMSCIYALCCMVVIGLTAIKRTRYRNVRRSVGREAP